MAMNKQRKSSNLLNILSYDDAGNIVLKDYSQTIRYNWNGTIHAFTGPLSISSIAAAVTDTDKFLVSDGGVLKYRTGAEVLSDIGAQAAGSYVPTTRTLTINGTTQDLSVDRSFTVSTANIYTSDGTLTGNRIVTMGAFTLSFEKDLLVNGLKVGRGADNNSSSTVLGVNGAQGFYTTAIGYLALNANTGQANVAVGYLAGRLNVSGRYNVVVGSNALQSLVSSDGNSAFGQQALTNTTGEKNVAVGFLAGHAASANSNTSGSNNIFIGSNSIGVSATESNRTWIGNSLTTSTWLAGNLLLGTTTDAGYKLDVQGTARVSGDALVNGLTVGKGGTSVGTNTALGLETLFANTTGFDNAAFGWKSSRNLTTGLFNSSFGVQSLFSFITGAHNSAFGNASLYSSVGSRNSAFGSASLYSLSSGNDNTALGNNAGRYIAGGATANTTSGTSIFIGSDTQALANSQTNQIVIGHTAIGLGSNTTVIGNSSTLTSAIYGNLLLGTITDAGQKLQVSGNAQVAHTYTHTTGVYTTGLTAYTNVTTPLASSYTTGMFYGAFQSYYRNNVQGSITVPNSAVMASQFNGTQVVFSTASTAITMTQASGGAIRAYSNQILQFSVDNAQATCSVSHVAGMQILAPYYQGANNPTITNYYGIVLNDSAEYSATFPITNRWGIYQAGVSDANYFAGNLLLGSVTNNGNKLQVEGSARINGDLGINTNPNYTLHLTSSTGPTNILAGNSASGFSQSSRLTLQATGGDSMLEFFGTGVNTAIYGISTQGMTRLANSGGSALLIDQTANASIVLATNANIRVTVKNTGQVNFKPLTADPSGAAAGDVYYNSTTNKLRVYDGTSWVDLN